MEILCILKKIRLEIDIEKKKFLIEAEIIM